MKPKIIEKFHVFRLSNEPTDIKLRLDSVVYYCQNDRGNVNVFTTGGFKLELTVQLAEFDRIIGK